MHCQCIVMLVVLVLLLCTTIYLASTTACHAPQHISWSFKFYSGNKHYYAPQHTPASLPFWEKYSDNLQWQLLPGPFCFEPCLMPFAVAAVLTIMDRPPLLCIHRCIPNLYCTFLLSIWLTTMPVVLVLTKWYTVMHHCAPQAPPHLCRHFHGMMHSDVSWYMASSHISRCITVHHRQALTVSNKTVPITNPNTVHEAHCKHMWEFRLALV